MKMQWIVEPQTSAETRIELEAVEIELEQLRIKYRAQQVEILAAEEDRAHLKRLLEVQLVREFEAAPEEIPTCVG